MSLFTRVFDLVLCALALAGAMASTATLAQSYPSKTIRFIAPYAPGGASDILGRVLAQKLSERMGQPIVVENRSGAGGNIAAGLVAKSAPDGYTILLAAVGHAVSPALYADLPYDPIKEFAPISLVALVPIMLVVHPSLPASNLKQLINLAKVKPGQLSYGSSGTGSSSHLSMELFKALARVNIIHVPYRGGQLLITDLIAGHIDVAFNQFGMLLPYVTSGRLKPIAMASAKRSSLMPNLPTVAESGVPGYEVSTWTGLMAPVGTARDIINKLNLETSRVLGLVDVRQRLAEQGIEPIGTTPEQFATYLESEVTKWKRVVREAGIKVE
jgi:tripartite-type tricarboxylate transporter receptor subunit TctC